MNVFFSLKKIKQNKTKQNKTKQIKMKWNIKGNLRATTDNAGYMELFSYWNQNQVFSRSILWIRIFIVTVLPFMCL